MILKMTTTCLHFQTYVTGSELSTGLFAHLDSFSGKYFDITKTFLLFVNEK